MRSLLAFIYNQNTQTVPDFSITVYDPQNEAGLPPVSSRQQAARELGCIDVCLEIINLIGKQLPNNDNTSNSSREEETEYQSWIRK